MNRILKDQRLEWADLQELVLHQGLIDLGMQ